MDAISKAWGVRQFKKLKPSRAARAAKQQTATVVHAKRWEPCERWGGTKPCTGHEHAPLGDTQMQQAEGMWKGNSGFVKKRIHAEILPWTGGKTYVKFDDLEASVFVNGYRNL